MKVQFTEISILFILLTVQMAGASNPNSNVLTMIEKSQRLTEALKISHELVAGALSNSKFLESPRQDSMKINNYIMRRTLERFQSEMSNNSLLSRMKFDELGVSAIACNLPSRPYAAVERGGTIIHICDRIFSESKLKMVSTLLHEYAHTIGINDECTADEFAFSIFIANGQIPEGGEYSSNGNCRTMTSAMRLLAYEIWPNSEKITSINPGLNVFFSQDILSVLRVLRFLAG